MAGYRKGAASERELIKLFAAKGYSVIRAAGSGVAGECPDLLVFRRGTQYAFECKAWGGTWCALEKDEWKALKKWEDNTGITTMLAWRMNGGEWRFVYLDELKETGKNYATTREKAEKYGMKLEELIR